MLTILISLVAVAGLTGAVMEYTEGMVGTLVFFAALHTIFAFGIRGMDMALKLDRISHIRDRLILAAILAFPFGGSYPLKEQVLLSGWSFAYLVFALSIAVLLIRKRGTVTAT